MYLTDAQLQLIEKALDEAGQFGRVVLVRDRYGLRYIEVRKSTDLRLIEEAEEKTGEE